MMGEKDKRSKREKSKKRKQDISLASRVQVVDVADWVTIRAEITNLDRLEKAIQKSLDSQRALTLQTQSLLAEIEKGGAFKRLGRAVWMWCQGVKTKLVEGYGE
jgi:hypothetical protein